MPLKEVHYLKDYKIEMIFENGKKKIHDFKFFLYNSTHPVIIKYRQLSLFKKVKIDSTGCLSWGENDMDFNPYNLPK